MWANCNHTYVETADMSDMDESTNNKTDTMKVTSDIIVMGEEPTPDRSPDDIREWYASHHDEKSLAEAYADADNEFWWVEDDIYDFEEGTPEYKKADERIQAWCDLAEELREKIFDILRAEGVTIPETGQRAVTSLFMERNGYYDGMGWWISKEEE
jgi:hypothetical protein